MKGEAEVEKRKKDQIFAIYEWKKKETATFAIYE